MEKYTLILWPFSQYYVGHPECFFYNGEMNGEFNDDLSQAIFVPESVLLSESSERIEQISNGLSGKFVAYSFPVDQSLDDGCIGCSYEDEEGDEDCLVFVESETDETDSDTEA